MNAPLFLDTGFAVALVIKRDQHRSAALALNERIERESLHVVTTRPVVVEIGNFLSSPVLRATGALYLNTLESDPGVEILPLSEGLFRQGFSLYRNRLDKAWSLTDCISFAAMREHDLTDALTGDEHFEQAGFGALLRAT